MSSYPHQIALVGTILTACRYLDTLLRQAATGGAETRPFFDLAGTLSLALRQATDGVLEVHEALLAETLSQYERGMRGFQEQFAAQNPSAEAPGPATRPARKSVPSECAPLPSVTHPSGVPGPCNACARRLPIPTRDARVYVNPSGWVPGQWGLYARTAAVRGAYIASLRAEVILDPLAQRCDDDPIEDGMCPVKVGGVSYLMRAASPISFANGADWPHRWRPANIVIGPPANGSASSGPWLYAVRDIAVNEELFLVYGYAEGEYAEPGALDDRCCPPLRPAVNTNPASVEEARSLAPSLPQHPDWDGSVNDAARAALGFFHSGARAVEIFRQRATTAGRDLSQQQKYDRERGGGEAALPKRAKTAGDGGD